MLGWILVCLLFSSCSVSSLYVCECDRRNFKLKTNYLPEQRDGVTDKDYSSSIDFLKGIYDDFELEEKGKKEEFSTASPWNLAVAFASLKEPKDKVLCMIRWAEEEDLEGTAYNFFRLSKESNSFNLSQQEYDALKQRYQPIYEEYLSKQKTSEPTIWAKDTLDQSLVRLMTSIVALDQKYRSDGKGHYLANLNQQNMIDSLNLLKVDSLFAHYGKYIGKSLVGESKEYAMWTVIQHAPLARQEEYLPIIQTAVETGELKQGPFKMLIDRIYTRKYSYQIFGSQAEVELGTEKQIKKAKRKHGLVD